MCTLGAATHWQKSLVYGGALELGNNWLPSLQAAGRIQRYANNVCRTSLRALLRVSTGARRAQLVEHDKLIAKLAVGLTDYQKLVSSQGCLSLASRWFLSAAVAASKSSLIARDQALPFNSDYEKLKPR